MSEFSFYFSYTGTNFRQFFFGPPGISPYSVRMRKNMDQKNFEYGHFLCSVLSQQFYITDYQFVSYCHQYLGRTFLSLGKSNIKLTTSVVIKIWVFLIFYQVFLSLQVKHSVFIIDLIISVPEYSRSDWLMRLNICLIFNRGCKILKINNCIATHAAGM